MLAQILSCIVSWWKIYRSDILTFFASLSSSENLDPVKVDIIPGTPSLFVSKPSHVYTMLTSPDFKSNTIDFFIDKFRDVLGFNVITVGDELHKGVRKRTMDAITGKSLRHIRLIMEETVNEYLLPRWKQASTEGKGTNIGEEMLIYSSYVVFRAFLDVPHEEIDPKLFVSLFNMFSYTRERVLTPLPKVWYYVIDGVKKLLRIRSPHDDRNFIHSWLLERKDSHYTKDNLYGWILRYHTKRNLPSKSLLMDLFGEIPDEDMSRDIYLLSSSLARKYPVESQSFEERRLDIANTLCRGGTIDLKLALEEMLADLIGGSETTILQMNWLIYYLALNPEIQDKLRQELTKAESPDKCTYLQWTLKEGLRLGSPSQIANRPTVVDTYLDSTFVPKGTLVWASHWVTHRHPLVWKDPMKFMPERWANKIEPGSFFTFNYGPRECPGSQYAYQEASTALVALITNFRVSLDPKTPIPMPYDMGLTYRNKCPIVIHLELLV